MDISEHFCRLNTLCVLLHFAEFVSFLSPFETPNEHFYHLHLDCKKIASESNHYLRTLSIHCLSSALFVDEISFVGLLLFSATFCTVLQSICCVVNFCIFYKCVNFVYYLIRNDQTIVGNFIVTIHFPVC